MKTNDLLTEDNLVDVFENLRESNLTKLEVSGTRFNTVPGHLLSVLSQTKVSDLFIAGMPISTIPRNAFPSMPRLNRLKLNSPQLQYIAEGAFDALVNLKVLVIQKNLFTSFPSSLQLSQLEELDLSGYPRHPIRFELRELSFSAMENLEILSLSFKSLLSLSKNTFYGLSRLKQLNVRKCGISSVKDGVFEHLTSLLHLDISENPLFELGTVSDKLFYGLQSTLDVLIIRGTNYKGEKDRFWANLANLQTLDISNNTLSTITGVLQSLKQLKRVYASLNSIQDWSQSILADNSSLVTLDLSQNSLRVVTQAMINDFSKVTHLNVSLNQFYCSCDIYPFCSWLNETNTTVSFYKKSMVSKHERLFCNSPAEYAQFSLREVGSILTTKCTVSIKTKSHYFLVFLAVILVIVFSSVVFIYVFRRKVRALLWGKQDLPNINFLYDAFVSYSANDSDWVFNSLLPHLENSATNMRLCVYDRDFIAGEAITDCILDSIKNSRRIVLVVSNSFVKSPWCKLETDLAHHILLEENREGLLLIRLGKLDLSKAPLHLKFLLSTRIYLEWTPDIQGQTEFWNKLKKALEVNSKTKENKLNSRCSLV